MSKKFNIKIRMNAACDTVAVETDAGKTVVDRSDLTKREKSSIRELVVDAFCDHANDRRLYAYD